MTVSGASLVASAIDPSQTVQLTADQFAAMIGTPEFYYLGTDMQYHAVTATRYASPPQINACAVDGYGATELNARPQIWYQIPYPADFAPNTLEPYYPNILLSLDLHFSGVTYCDFGVGSQYVNTSSGAGGSYVSQPLSVFSPWFYSQIGDDVSDVLLLSSRGSGSQYGGYCNYTNGVGSSMNAHKIEQQSPGDLYFGDISIAAVGEEPWTSSFYIIINAPVLNAGYVFEGHASPPTPGGDSGGTISGNGKGTITTDISGVTGFAWDVTLEMPEYMYSGTYSEYSDNFPATVSSIASGMEDYGTTAASALSELAEDADVGGLWGCITSFLPPGVIVLIMGLSGIYLVGWVLTRFSA